MTTASRRQGIDLDPDGGKTMHGIRRIFRTALFLIALTGPAAAGEDSGTFGILFENDIFFDTDREYTNGILFDYAPPAADTPEWAVRAARWLPFFADSGEVRTAYSLGQNMYTPEHYRIPVPLPTERPYAGYLYGAIAVLEKNPHRLDQVQLQFGVVGPWSLAEAAQKWVHAICCKNRKPLGWSYQLRNEPAVQLIYQHTFKFMPKQDFWGLSLDFEPHAGGAIGTVYDYFNAGAMIRAGYNLPDDFGPIRIEPGLPGSAFIASDESFSIYGFAGVDGRAIARNIFLDGNTWRDSRSVVKKNLVGDLALGLVVSYSRYRLSLTHVFRTREYKTQSERVDEFGAVNVSVAL